MPTMETWTVDPESLHLRRADQRDSFTAAEFARQVWPPCPVCGGRLSVDSIDAHTQEERDRVILGRWSCPKGCDPRGS